MPSFTATSHARGALVLVAALLCVESLGASVAAPTQHSKQTATLPGNLVFEAGKSTLRPGSGTEEVLLSLKSSLDRLSQLTLLRIEGYSDNAAASQESLRISGERALTVKRWLIGRGVAESRLVAVGFGDQRPIANNSSETGRAQNRRVEFKIAKLTGQAYLGNDPLGGGVEFK